MILDATSLIDLLAGIALSRDEPVVTQNVDAFSRTPVRVSPY